MISEAREPSLGRKPELQPLARPQVLLLGPIFGALGLLAVKFFVQADYFLSRNESEWTYERGYSPLELSAWIVYLLLAPAALEALLSGVLKALHRRLAAVVVAVVVLGELSIAALGWRTGSDLLNCAFIFCGDEPANAADPTGFFATTGAVVFIMSVAMAVAAIGMYVSSEKRPTFPQPHVAERRFARRRRLCAAVVLLLIPLAVVICGLLPGQWSRMTLNKSTLQKYAKSRQGLGSSEIAPCKSTEITPCGDAIFVTQNIDVGWAVVKLQPDVVLFYGTIEVILLLAVAEAEFPLLRRLTSKRIGRTTVGDIVKLAVLSLFFCGFLTYWLHDHLYEYGRFHETTEVTARGFGQTASATMGFLLLPSSKSSILLQAAGVSWEATVVLHISLGVLFLVFSFIHVATYFVRFSQLGYPTDVLPFNFGYFMYPINSPGKPMDDWTCPAMSTIYWPALVIFGWLPWRRRLHWEQFRYAHNFYLVLVPMVIIHAESSWYYILPGAALWLADRLARFMNAAERVDVREAIAHLAEHEAIDHVELITELRVTWAGHDREHSPGLYCFLNCPQISACEWHPFSISSSPQDREATFHIKGMDRARHSWTGKLHALVESLASPQDLVLHLDGPYGSPFSCPAPRLVLVAGGIGITPMQSTLRHALQTADSTDSVLGLERLHLVWGSRSPKVFDIFSDGIDLNGLPPSVSTVVSLYCSSCSTETTCRMGTVRPGRPPFEDLLAEELALGRCCLRVCGPEQMVSALSKAVEALPPSSRRMLDYEVWSFAF